MSKELERRLLRIERDQNARGRVRYDVSAVPEDEFGNPTGPEPDRELTEEEWAEQVERAGYLTRH